MKFKDVKFKDPKIKHEMFVRIYMKHSYFSNISLQSVFEIIIELLVVHVLCYRYI